MHRFDPVADDVFRVAAGRIGSFVSRASRRPADVGVALCGHAREGDAAPTEVRRRLFELPVDPVRRPRVLHDYGDASRPAAIADVMRAEERTLVLGGDRDALTHDLTAFHSTVERARSLVVSAEPHDAATHVFGARDVAPTERVITADEVGDAGVTMLDFAGERLDVSSTHPTFLALHLGAFDVPGVRAPCPLALAPSAYWTLHRAWLRRLNVRALGIYGLHPAHDPSAATARFAARLAHAFLHV